MNLGTLPISPPPLTKYRQFLERCAPGKPVLTMWKRAFLFSTRRPIAGGFLSGVGAGRFAAPLRNAIASAARNFSRARASPYRVAHSRRTHDLPDPLPFWRSFRIHANDEGGRGGAAPRSSPPILPLRRPHRRGALSNKVRRHLVFTSLSGVRCSKHTHYIVRRRKNRNIPTPNAPYKLNNSSPHRLITCSSKPLRAGTAECRRLRQIELRE